MGELLIPILIVMLAFAVVCRLLLVARCSCDGTRAMSALFALLHRMNCNQSVSAKKDSVWSDLRAAPTKRGGLNCRVQITKQEKDLPAVRDSGQAGDCVFDVFSVEICGLIPARGDTDCATLKVSIVDITDGIAKAKPIQARIKHWQVQEWFPQDGGQSVFCYNADLGKLPRRVTALSDWVSVAQMRVDWLRFPRKGKRNLQFNTSILSRESGEELLCAECTFAYENPDFGYIDLEENNRRTKTLTVALAFAVSAADNRLYDCEVELIKNWARANIGWAQASNKARRKLEKALNETIAFLRDGNQLNTYEICKELVEIAPLADRYEILDLCLYVVRANGLVTAEELDILKNLANWLEVDTDRFREMMGKILPVSMCEVKDAEVILGVTSDMNGEKAREQLNKEYIKWNSRVTNSNPEIQSQADQMLKLIAEARSRYTRAESSN
jgi:tellurite resistance protein